MEIKIGMKIKDNKQKMVINMVDININTSVITFNINGLNVPIRWQRLLEWIKKQDMAICYL